MENTRKNQRVILNVVNLSKARNLFSEGLTPVVKSTTRPRWQRMPKQNVFYYKSPLHHEHFVLSFAFSFDREDERYSFALAQPYSLSRYDIYVENLLNEQFDFLQVETLTQTIQNRPLKVLTITDPKNLRVLATDQVKPKVIVIMGRVRASQATSSFVIQGFIDFLTSDHEIAKSLREHLIFKVIPVVNPDGVFLGNTRGNLLGQDLNRCWLNPNKFQHPTVFALRKMILGLAKSSAYDLDMILDIHGHPTQLGLFVIGNAYDDVYRFERHSVFPKILSQICPDYSTENAIYNNDEEKAGSIRRYFCHCDQVSPEVNTYTVEVSMLGYKELETTVPYTDDTYCRIGRNMARSMWDYYKILGTIPLGSSDYTAPGIAVRSFNLYRLREIENQRIKSADSFEEENGDNAQLSDEEDDEKTKWFAPNIAPNEESPRQVLPMSVKSVVYGEEVFDDEDPPIFDAPVLSYEGHSLRMIHLSLEDSSVDDADDETDSKPVKKDRGESERTWTPTSSTSSLGSGSFPMRVHFNDGVALHPENSLIIKPATTVVIRPSASRYDEVYLCKLFLFYFFRLFFCQFAAIQKVNLESILNDPSEI